VVGTRGRSGFKKLLLVSDAFSVVSDAFSVVTYVHCPVIVVKRLEVVMVMVIITNVELETQTILGFGYYRDRRGILYQLTLSQNQLNYVDGRQ
jgi:hypothetical protein